MKRNNKGFTLIELLAVIVVLSIILTIATTAVLKTIKDSKEKAKYIAAKEIANIAEAYFATHSTDEVKVKDLCNEYMENNATNPATGENIESCEDFGNQTIKKDAVNEQSDYKLKDGEYSFDGYVYSVIEQQNNSSSLETTTDVSSDTTYGDSSDTTYGDSSDNSSEIQDEERFEFMCCKGTNKCKRNERYFKIGEQFTCSTNKVGVEIALISGTGLSSRFNKKIITTSDDLTKQFMFGKPGVKSITAIYNNNNNRKKITLNVTIK